MNTTHIQQIQAFEQEQLVGYWLKTKGLTRNDLLNHKCIDDLILIINYKSLLGKNATLSSEAFFGFAWDWVYIKKRPLKNKHLKALEQHIHSHTYRLRKIQQIRQSLQQLRENQDTERRDYDMTAKESRIATAG